MKNARLLLLALMVTCASAAGRGAVAADAARSPALKRSIGGWVSCSGSSDDTAGVARAFAAARHAAFTLVVDCPVLLQSGMDIARTIYIDDGTTVEFTGSGKFMVDNVMHPAFVIAGSKDVTLKSWNVEYVSGLPIDGDVRGYMRGGRFVTASGRVQPAGAFNNFGITPWLAANRAITFDQSQGSVTGIWRGGIIPMAVIWMTGDTSNVRVTGMRLYVAASSGGDRFIPVAFSMSPNFKNNQTVTAKTPITGQFVAVPHDLTFSDIVLDGTYMGWLGNARDALFQNIRSHRYADLQDPSGNNVGGMGKWFAPPHLFYLNYMVAGDSALFNSGVHIKDVVDDGPRIGAARDKGGTDSISGYATSLKIGCVDCSVDNYKTTRPDGFLDVLPSDGLTVSNVDATYDSTFLNNVFPGWRFPSSPYRNLVFKDIVFKDSAASTIQAPIGGATDPANENIVFSNVHIIMNRWSGKGLPVPNILGHGINAALDYAFTADASHAASVQKGSVTVTLSATPATPGAEGAEGATMLRWTSRGANSCAAAGAWSGATGTSGSRTVNVSGAGDHDFTLNCQGTGDSASATLRVAVQ